MSSPRPPSHRTALGVAVLIAASALSCKKEGTQSEAVEKKSTPAEAAPTAPPQNAPNGAEGSPKADTAASPPPGGTPKAEVVVVEPGQNAQVIRYAFRKDQKKKFNLKLTVQPQVTVSGKKMPEAPTTTFEVSGTNTTEEVLPDGTARRVAAFEKFSPSAAGLPEAARAQLKSQFGALEGVKIQELLSSRGEVRGVEVVELPAQNPGIYQLLENLQDGLSNAVLPLPEGPIGKGGRWTATQKTRASGMQISQTTQFTLREIKGDRLLVDIVFEQLGAPSKLEAAGLPPGASIELVSLKGEGKGTAEVNLKSLDMRSDVSITMDMHTRTEGPGAPGPVDSQTHNKLTVGVSLKD